MELDVKAQLDLFYSLLRIRRVEEEIAKRYKEQKMRTPIHLSVGQEAVAVAVGRQLRVDDYAVSTHRPHAHYLAKGGSLKSMIAEIYGKVTGCCRGRGGSMHLIDTSAGFMGSTAIVSNTIPIGVGLGLSIQLSNEDKVSCVFVGDGAAEEGVFFESLNFAVLKKLPILFICENNRFSVYSPIEKRQPIGRNIYDVAKAIGARAYHGNGYDLLASYELVKQAIDAIRSGSGPHFIEFETYRWLEHCGPDYDNDLGYRNEAEFLFWKGKDPVEQFRKHILSRGYLTGHAIQEMESKIQKEIREAFHFAELSAFPDPIEAISGQYKTEKLELIKELQLVESVTESVI